MQEPEVLAALVEAQAVRPALRVIVLGNLDFELNPYHPGKAYRWLSRLTAWVLRRETGDALRVLRSRGCNFEFRVWNGKYTHNKIAIFDRRTLIIGTFNLHERALVAGNDVEVGLRIECGGVSAAYVELVQNETTVVGVEGW